MTNREGKRWRQEIKQALREKERQRFEAALPASEGVLRSLFDYIDNSEEPCDHTLKRTLAFIRERGLAEALVVDWLNEHGGYCDCEVIANVEDELLRIMGNDR